MSRQHTASKQTFFELSRQRIKMTKKKKIQKQNEFYNIQYIVICIGLLLLLFTYNYNWKAEGYYNLFLPKCFFWIFIAFRYHNYHKN